MMPGGPGSLKGSHFRCNDHDDGDDDNDDDDDYVENVVDNVDLF